MKIRISNFYFIKHDLNQLNYLLRIKIVHF